MIITIQLQRCQQIQSWRKNKSENRERKFGTTPFCPAPISTAEQNRSWWQGASQKSNCPWQVPFVVLEHSSLRILDAAMFKVVLCSSRVQDSRCGSVHQGGSRVADDAAYSWPLAHPNPVTGRWEVTRALLKSDSSNSSCLRSKRTTSNYQQNNTIKLWQIDNCKMKFKNRYFTRIFCDIFHLFCFVSSSILESTFFWTCGFVWIIPSHLFVTGLGGGLPWGLQRGGCCFCVCLRIDINTKHGAMEQA